MLRLLPLLLIHWGAWRVLCALWPEWRRGRRRVLAVALGGLTLGAWALIFLGSGALALLGAAGRVWRIVAAVGAMTAFGLLAGAGPVLLARSVWRRWLGWRRSTGECSEDKASQAQAAPIEHPSKDITSKDVLSREDSPADPSRRAWLVRLGAGVPAALAASSAGGVVAGLRPPVVRYEEVQVPGLPAALEGLRIGQTTDLHVGPFVSPLDVSAWVDRLDAEGVDLQVMTGDLIDDLTQLEATFEALGRCRAPLGMVGVLGNHEHFRGLGPVRRAWSQLASRGRHRLMVDESLRLERDGAALRLVGVDYPMVIGGRGARERAMRRSAVQAFGGVQDGETVVCLSHHPDFFPIAAEYGAALTLSGHTHGGQIAVLGVPVFAKAFDHMLGRYRRGDRHLYVSGGSGHWMPMRVGVPAELTVVTLRRA